MEGVERAECCPIKYIEELKEWEPSFVKHITAPLRKRIPVNDCPKTLICHDMRGGYLEDRFVHGCKAEDCYYFIHWSLVDSFVYFSHHLVTIPPCGWISAAHQNGVKVLGTFITEWDAGEKVCEELFKDSNTVLHYSRQLTRIAAFYSFDGWLINIENKLRVNQIPLLKQFIKLLTDMMHSFRSHSLVVWYDSVIESGDLKWQNALNEQNRDFFCECDGIFLNYNWKDEDLKLSVSEAGLRKTDVYVGVDVFGRGCLGGGGFCTNIAAEEARKYGLSIAIFAPGWVHECLDVKDFPENQQKFWSALNDVCTVRAFESLPFVSSFCPGFGKKLFRNGKVVCNEPWYNISLLQPQPTFYSSHSSKGSNIVMYVDDAYNGGGCLCLNGKFNGYKKFYDFKILSTQFALENSYIISYTFKPLVNGLDVMLTLSIQCYEGSYELCLTEEKENEILPADSSIKYKMPTSRDELLNTTYKETDENLLSETNWMKRTYTLQVDCFDLHTIKNVTVRVCNQAFSNIDANFSVLLGQLEIVPLQKKFEFTYKDLSYTFENNIPTWQCLLHWTQDPSVYCSDLFICTRNKEKLYLGTTSQFFYEFKYSDAESPEVELLLVPQSSGDKHFDPLLLKIPLKKS